MSEKFNKEEIAELLQMLNANDVTEFELQRGSEKLWLKRKAASASVAYGISNVAPQQVVQNVAVAPAQEVINGNTLPPPAAPAPKVEENLHEVCSPMVGTFYRRPAVDAEVYVSVGDKIKKGNVLCIVEAMKLMNEIESDVSGEIVEVCLDDAQTVEYGEVLFKVRLSS